MKEKWKPVKKYNGLYEVSNHGKIKSIDSYRTNSLGHKRFIKGKIIKGYIDQDGYSRVILYPLSSNWKNRKMFYLHVLVLEAFKSPKNGRVCRHLDGNPQNNNINNLMWGTSKQNKKDSIRHGTAQRPKGTKSKMASLTQDQVNQIKKLKGIKTQEFLSKKFNVSRTTIHRVWSGKRYE